MAFLRAEFVEGVRSQFYGEGSPLPVPHYILDAALMAAVNVVMSRGRAGLSTYWDVLGSFCPYVRPGRVRRYRVKRPSSVWPGYVYVDEDRELPAQRWLYFRSARPSVEFENFYLWGIDYESSYAGGDDGKYMKGRRAVYEAVRGELSKVTKGREWGRYFVHGENGLEASPYFVNGLMARFAWGLAIGGNFSCIGFGYLARGGYVRRKLPHPVTGVVSTRYVVEKFVYRRFPGSALGLAVEGAGGEGGGVGGSD